MTPKSRLHLHSHRGPGETAYIVGEPAALLHLAAALKAAAKGVIGLETVTSYTSDGHQYKIVICSDVAEEEWQNTLPCHDLNSTAENFQTIKIYRELLAEK